MRWTRVVATLGATTFGTFVLWVAAMVLTTQYVDAQVLAPDGTKIGDRYEYVLLYLAVTLLVLAVSGLGTYFAVRRAARAGRDERN